MHRVFIQCSDKVYLIPLFGGETVDRCGKFKDSELGFWTGFYDWLRSDAKQIIGVRYWPFEEAAKLLRRKHLGCLMKTSNAAILIFFGNSQGFNEDLSNDQAFEESRLMLDRDTESVAFVFGCSHLTDEERLCMTATNSKA